MVRKKKFASSGTGYGSVRFEKKQLLTVLVLGAASWPLLLPAAAVRHRHRPGRTSQCGTFKGPWKPAPACPGKAT